jgi:hypothetical protein
MDLMVREEREEGMDLWFMVQGPVGPVIPRVFFSLFCCRALTFCIFLGWSFFREFCFAG